MRDIFLYFTLGCLLTLQIFLFYEFNKMENMLILAIAGIPFTEYRGSK